MAGRIKLLAMAVLLAMITFGCSSEGDDETLELEPAESSTTTTTEATTTSTIATTTTLSEQAQAEADVAQLVEDYWTAPTDTSQGLFGLEYTTGLVRTRSQGALEQFEANGQILFNDKRNPFKIITLDVDVEQGEAEVKACQSSYSVLLDADTGEQLQASDPEALATSVYHLELTDDGWKIYELIGSSLTDTPELCEIES